MKKLTTIITTLLTFFSLILPTFAQITIGDTGQATGINLSNIHPITPTTEILSITDETPTSTTTTNTETTEETNHDLPPLPPPPKENISATFTTSPQVNYGSYQWTIELTTDTSDEITLDTTKVQIWNAFKITDYTKFGSKLIITLEPKQAPLDVECNTYTLTIPKKALTTLFAENEKNITGNFQVLNCPEKTQNEENKTEAVGTYEENSTNSGSTLKEGNLYLSILDADENGKQYINITNLVYLLGIISFFLILFFVLFGFLKNSFLGKGKKY